jgi:hypothetical protein
VFGPTWARRFDIADIVRAHRTELEASRWVNTRQRRALTDIAQCRTEALGGHLEQCTACNYQQPVYHSCRNRHCPKCQALAQEKWIEQQRQRMLDVKHFHVVFTLPAELRSLATFAPRVVYDAMFRVVGRTLLEFGQSNLDATLGATLVLHTWTRDLRYHPHIHAIVTAGGLSLDGKRFLQCHPTFLFPVAALAKVFRAKLIDILWKAYRSSQFDGYSSFDDPEGFPRLVRRLPRAWVVYAKPSFDRGEHVLQYLGRYTHRVGIANSRLIDVTDDAVTFRTKNGNTTTLHPIEFLRRFICHILPDGFHKIRHVGLNISVDKRDAASAALAQASLPQQEKTWQQRLVELTGRDVCHCPRCHAPLRCTPLDRRSRAPPSTLELAA